MREKQTEVPAREEIADLVEDLFSDDEEERDKAIAWFRKTATTSLNSFFFAPYQNKIDFGCSLIAPVTSPLMLGITAGLAAISAAVGAIVCIEGLLITAGIGWIGLFNEDVASFTENAVKAASIGALVALLAAVITTALLLLTAIIIPLAVTAIFTRSGTTVISALSECFSTSESHDKENLNDSDKEDTHLVLS